MKNKYNIWTVLMGAGAIALAGCHSEDLVEQDAPIREVKGLQTYTLTLDATKQMINEAETRALFLMDAPNKQYIDAYWADTDIVKVFKDGSCIGTLNVTPGEGTRPQSAMLSGEITTEGLAIGNELMLLFPRENWDYTGQTGDLMTGEGSIATNYDYATATVNVASINGHNITTQTGAIFENQQSIYAFKLKLDNSTFPMKQFTISSAQGKLVQERSYSNGAWTSTWRPLIVTPVSSDQTIHYVSVRNEISSDVVDELYFVAIGVDDDWTSYTNEKGLLYMGSKTISADKLGDDGEINGKYFKADVQMAEVDMDPKTSTVGEVW
jgi:hypothetical protein